MTRSADGALREMPSIRLPAWPISTRCAIRRTCTRSARSTGRRRRSYHEHDAEDRRAACASPVPCSAPRSGHRGPLHSGRRGRPSCLVGSLGQNDVSRCRARCGSLLSGGNSQRGGGIERLLCCRKECMSTRAASPARHDRPLGDGTPSSQFYTDAEAPTCKTLVKPAPRSSRKNQRPPLTRSFGSTDHYTPREFVAPVLRRCSHQNADQAYRVMMTAHRVSAIAVYTRQREGSNRVGK